MDLYNWRHMQALQRSGGPGDPMRHRRLGVRPCAWEVDLEQFHTFVQEAMSPEELQELETKAGQPLTTWWVLASIRDVWHNWSLAWVLRRRW